MRTGVIGGHVGYELLRRLGRQVAAGNDPCDGSAYRDRSKVETLFGPRIWATLAGRVVVDFGCGDGSEAIEIARHGARRVIGIDVRRAVLERASRAAELAGLADRCVFVPDTADPVDVVLSIDAFEHYDKPEGILSTMRRLVHPNGRVLIAFGPPWFHPLGGHLFSIFPWAHLVFSEEALLRWRADFKSDGATRFGEVEGGLNQMTVRRFGELVRRSEFDVVHFEAVPIRRLRWLSNPVTREFVTSVVRCTLAPRSNGGAGEGA
jgi:SAM-dependent methyltransferase